MRAVQTVPMIGVTAELVLLVVLTVTVGLSGPGSLVGTASALLTTLILARAMSRQGAARLGPANQVTLTRAMLACSIAALVVSSVSRPAPVPTMVAICSVALALDAVDGWVARRTRSTSPLGARFDMEVDAFLILVLSVYVARSAGLWVLAIGSARYLFVAARWVLPWMRGDVPPRRWCKAVAAIQGVVLTAVAADFLPPSWEYAALTASLLLLAESFGREVWWLWSRVEPSRRQPVLSAAGVVGDG